MPDVSVTWLGHASFRLDSPGGQADLRRPLARQPEVPRVGEGARADRRDRAHARPRRPRRRDGRAGEAVHSPRSSRNVELNGWLAAARAPRWTTCPARTRAAPSRPTGIKFTLVNAFHSSGSDDGDYLGEAAGIVVRARERDDALLRRRHLRLRRHAADRRASTRPTWRSCRSAATSRWTRARPAVALELLGVKRCIPCHYGTFPLLTGTPDELREHAPGRRDDRAAARGDDHGLRERWFGATGRRVPEIAVEGELELGDALVLDDVSDEAALKEAHERGPAGRRPRRRGRASRRRSRGPRSRRVLVPAVEARAARARPDGADLWLAVVATYSIAACDLEAGQWGVATQSKFLGVGSVVPWAEPQRRRDRDAGLREPALRPRRAGAAAGGPERRGGRRAADRGRRGARPPAARRRRRQGRQRELHRVGVHDWAGGRTGAVLRGAGQHPRLGGDRGRDRRDVRASRGRSRSPSVCSTASTPRRPPAATGAASSPRRCSSSSGTAATRASPTAWSTCASTSTSGRSRSCGASTACTRRSSARRRGRTGSTVDDELARSCASGSARLGYEGELGRAFVAWAGNENLEERVDGVERVDPVVLEELRRQT